MSVHNKKSPFHDKAIGSEFLNYEIDNNRENLSVMKVDFTMYFKEGLL